MIWLTWRQFRAQAVAGLIGIAAVVAIFAATRPALTGLARSTGYLGCTTGCADLAETFVDQAAGAFFGVLYYFGIILLFGLPGLIGLFWGAPLVARELETGTHRLAWSQSVSRRRWLAVKLGGVGLATVAAAGASSVVITWWASLLDQAGGWIQPSVFGSRGIVPIGY